MLRDMIISVNEEHVASDEKLGQSPFVYSKEFGLLPV